MVQSLEVCNALKVQCTPTTKAQQFLVSLDLAKRNESKSLYKDLSMDVEAASLKIAQN